MKLILDFIIISINQRIHGALKVPTLEEYLQRLVEDTWSPASISGHLIVWHLVELDPNRPPPKLRARKAADVINISPGVAGQHISDIKTLFLEKMSWAHKINEKRVIKPDKRGKN